jgi:ABC-type uncharacterized transport system auxiliary subunit
LPPFNPVALIAALTHHFSGSGVSVMRVFVVTALAATLAGCATTQPQRPVHTTARFHKVAVMKKWHRHHNRAGGNVKPEAKATTAAHHASDVVGADAAKRIEAVIAAKLGNPASITFQDVVAGKVADSFCGVAQVAGAAGATTEMPFVVHGNEAYIIDGSDDRRASAALQDLCD